MRMCRSPPACGAAALLLLLVISFALTSPPGVETSNASLLRVPDMFEYSESLNPRRVKNANLHV
jgi:hypothetical protein